MNRKTVLGNMTSTPIKAYLSRGYFAPLEIMNKLKQIDSLQADEAANSKEIADMVSVLKEDISKLRRQYDEVKNHIQSFSHDWRFIQILELRYIHGLSFSDIAKQIGYCDDHVIRQHGRAVKAFEKYLNENGIEYQ